MAETREIILIKETAFQSWMRDVSTFSTFIGLIGVGWFLDSSAMQWSGAIIGFVMVLGRSKKKEWTYTIEEARKRLDELDAPK